jgi:hypothetical protein
MHYGTYVSDVKPNQGLKRHMANVAGNRCSENAVDGRITKKKTTELHLRTLQNTTEATIESACV